MNLDNRVPTRCTEPGCDATGRAPQRRVDRWRCVTHRTEAPTPEPRNVNWPELVACAARHQVPVSRVDALGRLHILRSPHDLTKWGQQ